MNPDASLDWSAVYSQIEDFLIPGLRFDAWDRSLYYHLLRHTRLKGKDSAIFAIGPLSKATAISDFKVRGLLDALIEPLRSCFSMWASFWPVSFKNNMRLRA